MRGSQVKAGHSYVVFADLVGYSQLTDKHLSVFHGRVLPDIAKRLKLDICDYVNVWGDALVFAGPHLRPMVRDALELRDAFQNRFWTEDDLPQLTARISMHRGEMLKGEDPFSRRGVIVGRSVVTAARIEPITTPGMIWVSEAVAIDVKENQRGEPNRMFEVDEIGEIPLAKRFGQARLFRLRRPNEAALTQQEIDDIRRASEERLAAERRLRSTTSTGDGAQPREHTAAVGIVVQGGKVALVKRRPNSEGLDWMFPSGAVLPLQAPKTQVWREVMKETGLSCMVRDEILPSRVHPVTGVICRYFHLTPLEDNAEVSNRDTLENEDARWVAIDAVADLIGDGLYAQVAEYLDGLGGKVD